MKTERFEMTTRWTGNCGTGTSGYTAYGRDHEFGGRGKAATIPGSSVPIYRGDGTRYSPEELLVASASACHMLWFLHLCADAGIVVTAYVDDAEGVLRLDGGSGEFAEIVLHPRVEIDDETRRSDLTKLHDDAHERCFIARSLRCPVRVANP